MPDPLPKGTVIGHKPCPACTSNQPLKVTKSGLDVCQICGMCSGRFFFGREPSQALIRKYRGAKPDAAPEAPPAKPKTPSAGEWYYDD